MPENIRVLSGKAVIKIFERYGFTVTRVQGSHVRMTLTQGRDQFHVTIPNHKELKLGTMMSIVKEFTAIFDKDICKKVFYHK